MLCSVSAVYALLFAVSFVSPASAQLPPYTGQYGVGTVDIEAPVEPRNVSQAVFADTGEPAFQLETVLFSIFYPAAKGANSTKAKHPWVPRPLDLIARGIATYTNSTGSPIDPGLISLGLTVIAGGIEIPAAVDIPLYGASERFPVLVFSHGDATLRTWYSQYCGELASRGYVTVSIEHRDGSGPASQVVQRDGSTRNVTYITVSQLSPAMNTTELKMQQRDFRQAEVEEVIRVLQNITEGSGDSIYRLNSRNEGQNLSSWRGRLDLGTLLVGGHSFGATSALQTLREAPNGTIPAHGAIVLDPGKESGPLNSDIRVPILIADSEEWSSLPTVFYGRQHFDVVKDVAQSALDHSAASWFMTLLGTAHISITDAAIIGGQITDFFGNSSFNATIDPADSLAQYVRVSSEFFDFVRNGTRSGVLAAGVTHPQYGVANETAVQSTPEEVRRFWQIHVAPPTQSMNTGGRQSHAPRFVTQHWLMLLMLIAGASNW